MIFFSLVKASILNAKCVRFARPAKEAEQMGISLAQAPLCWEIGAASERDAGKYRLVVKCKLRNSTASPDAIWCEK